MKQLICFAFLLLGTTMAQAQLASIDNSQDQIIYLSQSSEDIIQPATVPSGYRAASESDLDDMQDIGWVPLNENVTQQGLSCQWGDGAGSVNCPAGSTGCMVLTNDVLDTAAIACTDANGNVTAFGAVRENLANDGGA